MCFALLNYIFVSVAVRNKQCLWTSTAIKIIVSTNASNTFTLNSCCGIAPVKWRGNIFFFNEYKKKKKAPARARASEQLRDCRNKMKKKRKTNTKINTTKYQIMRSNRIERWWWCSWLLLCCPSVVWYFFSEHFIFSFNIQRMKLITNDDAAFVFFFCSISSSFSFSRSEIQSREKKLLKYKFIFHTHTHTLYNLAWVRNTYIQIVWTFTSSSVTIAGNR